MTQAERTVIAEWGETAKVLSSLASFFFQNKSFNHLAFHLLRRNKMEPEYKNPKYCDICADVNHDPGAMLGKFIQKRGVSLGDIYKGLVNCIDIWIFLVELNLGRSIYIGPMEALRPRARVLARACSFRSARSVLPAKLVCTCRYLARFRAAISSASSICFL